MTFRARQIEGLSINQLIDQFSPQPGFICLEGRSTHAYSEKSIVGIDPFLKIIFENDCVTCLWRDGRQEISDLGFFDCLKQYEILYHDKSLPAGAGLMMGYFGYESARCLDDFSFMKKGNLMPDAWVGFYDESFVIDHVFFKVTHYCLDLFNRPFSEIKKVVHLSGSFSICQDLTPLIKYESYERCLNTIYEYLLKGEVYQINFTYPMKARFEGNVMELYQQMSDKSNVPFSACITLENDCYVGSFSPERLFHLKQRKIESMPIKGTMPRDSVVEKDEDNLRFLKDSKKNEAELVMIVDLIRHDLARLCDKKTIEVPFLKRITAYPNVYHLDALVTGILKKELTALDVLQVMMPGGSITGAPKIRSAQLIEGLESFARQVYTGHIGYIGFNGDADFNVAIRTFYSVGKDLYFHVGGGIVADSYPEEEWAETKAKAKILLDLLTRS